MAEEYALAFDQGRETRLLIVPALFDEANRVRRLTVEVMRRLDASGIDCFLPDLPGCNESLQDLEKMEIADWSDAMDVAAREFGATHALGIRGGCLFMPHGLPGWHYGPVKGASVLRQMVRARIIASREAGREESREALMEAAEREGIELAGYALAASFVRLFGKLEPVSADSMTLIGQDLVGGSPLWLRAEPDEDASQADALAAILAIGMTS